MKSNQKEEEMKEGVEDNDDMKKAHTYSNVCMHVDQIRWYDASYSCCCFLFVPLLCNAQFECVFAYDYGDDTGIVVVIGFLL